MRGKWRAQRADRGAHAARGFVGGAAANAVNIVREVLVSMPHAALWVVQLVVSEFNFCFLEVSMPHAALWVVQHKEVYFMKNVSSVSMPHAALWVVQRNGFFRV